MGLTRENHVEVWSVHGNGFARREPGSQPIKVDMGMRAKGEKEEEKQGSEDVPEGERSVMTKKRGEGNRKQ